MNVLLLGSGGREHALVWALWASPLLSRLYAAPGNAGICEIATCVPLDPSDHAAVIAFCREHGIDLVVVGPEGPLVAGLVDLLDAAGIRAFGPSQDAARLEGSKGFTKDLCREAGIPTAAYRRFDDADAAVGYVRDHPLPVVVKADGLAAGKGVTVAGTRDEAESAVAAIFSGSPGASVVIEEFLAGEEASLFALCDGRNALLLASAQDHKRAFDGDEGPNTGGMGAVSPAPIVTPDIEARAMREIIHPTLDAMAQRGTLFRGVLYAGLMIEAGAPRLIEYNVRFGDPEAQALMVRLDSDLLALILACLDGTLEETRIAWRDEAALTIVMAARGYPGAYATGTEIRGVEEAGALPGVRIFHAGTRREGTRLLAAGGRVLSVTALGRDLMEAHARAYAAADRIYWPEGFCRRDIGERAIRRARGSD